MRHLHLLILALTISASYSATVTIDSFDDGATTNGAPMTLAASARAASHRFVDARTTLEQTGLTNVWAGCRNVWLHQGQIVVTGGALTITKASAAEAELFYAVADPATASSATGVNLSSITISAGAITSGPCTILVEAGNLTAEGVSTASGTLASSGAFTKTAGDFTGDANTADIEWIRIVVKSGGTSVVLNSISIEAL